MNKIPASYYDRDYFEGGKGAYQGQELCDEGAEAQAADWLISRHNLTPDKKVLDLGCSKGLRVYLLVRRGVDAYGIDCSEYAINYHNKYTDERKSIINKRIQVGSVESLPYKDSEFNMVCGFDLLEHLIPEQIDNCIKEAIRVSKNHVFFHFYIGKNKDIGIPENESDKSHISVYSMEWWKNKVLSLTDLSIQMGEMGTIGWCWIWKNLDIDIGEGNFFQKIKNENFSYS